MFLGMFLGMFHRRPLPHLPVFALAFLTACSARAADAPPNLAAALAALKPAKDETVLSAGAAQAPLPAGEAAPAPDSPLSGVALTYHKTLRRFGAVAAVAPPTMTLLNARPVNANIYDGMPPPDALKFLAASLTAGQWQQLVGEQGLGLSDMVSDTQSSLFRAVLPQKLSVVPQPLTGADASVNASAPRARDLTALLPQVRLRLRRRLGILVAQLGASNTVLNVEAARDVGQGTHYRVGSDGYSSFKTSLYGVPVRAEVENIPKIGDLDWDGPALRAPVPLMGIKTVGDLLARAGRASGLELYADRRWEGRPVTLLGAPPSAPAADLLRALAFCLTGAFRRVRPAYVLTDDVLGAGSRRAALAQFAATATAMRQKALLAAGDSMAGVRSLTDLPLAPDSMTFSPAQKKAAQPFYDQTGFSSLTQTLDQLTPEQKAAVEATPATTTSGDGVTYTPDLAGQIIVGEDPALELLVPTINGPVDAGLHTTLYALFQPTPPPVAPASPAGGGPAASLAALIKPIQGRAVLSSPHSAAEVKDLVTTMQKLGLNQLWLPVAPAGGFPSLAQVIQAAKGTGIGVYAVVDLLARPHATAADGADLTLLGRTSAQAQADLAEREGLAGPTPYKPPSGVPAANGVAVSPFFAAVGKDLLALTHTLATTPGLAGTVWRTTATPGYDEKQGMAPDPDFLPLGYAPPARLAFLRKEHVDPIDLSPSDMRWVADTSLPLFDDIALENTLETKWDQFRADADKSLLRSLFQQFAADGAASLSKPLLLVQQRGARPPTVTWYGSWAGPPAPFPAFQASSTPVAERIQARAQSKLTVVNLPLQGPLTESAVQSQWSGPLKSIAKNHSWGGFVLDCRPAGLAP